MTLNPTEIYQEYLDFMAEALINRDLEGFFSRLYFPHVITTENGTSVTHKPEELHHLFYSVVDYLESHGVTDYARLVQRAEQESSNVIRAEWVTHMMTGSQRVMEPYPSRGRLQLVNGQWLSSHVVQGIRYQNFPAKLPLVSDNTHSHTASSVSRTSNG